MDKATKYLIEFLNCSGDSNSQSYALAGSIASAMLVVALIFVVWALATKKDNAKSYLIALFVCVVFTLLFILK